LVKHLSAAEALAVPTCMVLAEQDTVVDNKALLAMFEANRRSGGLWAVAVEPGVPHHSLSPGHRVMIVNWLRTIVGLRLGDPGQQSLRDIAESSGWLGHPDYGVADWAGYAADRRAASWFPSKASARS